MSKFQKMISLIMDQIRSSVCYSLLLILNAFSQSTYVRNDKAISDQKGS